MSLTARLVLAIAGPVALAALGMGLMTDRVIRDEAARATAARAETVARLLEGVGGSAEGSGGMAARLDAVPNLVGVVWVGDAGEGVVTTPPEAKPPERLRRPATDGAVERTTLLGVPVLASWVTTDWSAPDAGVWVAFDRRPLERQLVSSRLTTGSVAVLAVAVAILIAILAAGAIVPPLNATVRTLESIATGGDAGRHEPRGPRELRQLASAVNRLLHSVAWARDGRATEAGGTNRYLQQSNRALLDLANRDPLTGLANRRRLEAELDRYLEMARGARQEVSVVMMDLDRFKRYNDTAGHLAGDALLRSVSSALRSRTRVTDLVVRWGGDEFCVLLPFTTSERALAAARSLIEAVCEAVRSLDLENGAAGVGASAGVACFPEDAGTGEELVARADEALFEAKRRGGGVALRAGGAQQASG